MGFEELTLICQLCEMPSCCPCSVVVCFRPAARPPADCILENDTNEVDYYDVTLVNGSSEDLYVLFEANSPTLQMLSPEGAIGPADPCGTRCSPPYDQEWCPFNILNRKVERLPPGGSLQRWWSGMSSTYRTLPASCLGRDVSEPLACIQQELNRISQTTIHVGA
jgi:hypothetical protein